MPISNTNDLHIFSGFIERVKEESLSDEFLWLSDDDQFSLKGYYFSLNLNNPNFFIHVATDFFTIANTLFHTHPTIAAGADETADVISNLVDIAVPKLSQRELNIVTTILNHSNFRALLYHFAHCCGLNVLSERQAEKITTEIESYYIQNEIDPPFSNQLFTLFFLRQYNLLFFTLAALKLSVQTDHPPPKYISYQHAANLITKIAELSSEHYQGETEKIRLACYEKVEDKLSEYCLPESGNNPAQFHPEFNKIILFTQKTQELCHLLHSLFRSFSRSPSTTTIKVTHHDLFQEEIFKFISSYSSKSKHPAMMMVFSNPLFHDFIFHLNKIVSYSSFDAFMRSISNALAKENFFIPTKANYEILALLKCSLDFFAANYRLYHGEDIKLKTLECTKLSDSQFQTIFCPLIKNEFAFQKLTENRVRTVIRARRSSQSLRMQSREPETEVINSRTSAAKS